MAVGPEARNLAQSAYQVVVAPTEAILGEEKRTLWDSGKVASDQSLHVTYAGKELVSHASCWWKVRVWEEDNKVSAWSTAAQWSMGMLDAKDWSAQWIGWDGGEETDEPFASLRNASWIWYPGAKATVGAPLGTRYFRRTVNVPEGRRVRKALLFATADDAFVAYVNGRSAGSGRSWAEVQLFDVTAQLRPGANTLAIAATNSPSPNVGPDKNPAGLIGAPRGQFRRGRAASGSDRFALAQRRQASYGLGKGGLRRHSMAGAPAIGCARHRPLGQDRRVEPPAPAGAAAAARVRGRQGGPTGDRLRLRSRLLRPARKRPDDQRPAHEPRIDRLRPSRALRHVRRDATPFIRATTPWASSWPTAVISPPAETSPCR